VNDGPFSRRALVLIIGFGLLSFAVAIALAVSGDGGVVPSAASDAYSRSALGHHALVEILRRLDVPVSLSRHDSAGRTASRGVLVVAEPRLTEGDKLRTMLEGVRVALLVLPKRLGVVDPRRRAWIERAELDDLEHVTAVLAAAGIEGQVVRGGPVSSWTVAAASGLGAAHPSLAAPQLISGSKLEPVIAAGDGILIGKLEVDDRVLFVLADPDLIANHGIGRGDNAVVATALLERLRDGGAVVFDETLHGHVSAPSLWGELATFPLSLAPASALLAFLALLWATTGRFGAPVPGGPGLAAGKLTLIDNIAELTGYGGHVSYALERYLQATMQDVARRTHAPAHAEARAWLTHVEAIRRVGIGLATLEREVRSAPPHQALAVATRIHRWREDMIHGPARDPRA